MQQKFYCLCVPPHLERERPPDADDDGPLLEVDGHHEGRLPDVHVIGDVDQPDAGDAPQGERVGGLVAPAAVVVHDRGRVQRGGVVRGRLEPAAAAAAPAAGAAAAAAAVAPQARTGWGEAGGPVPEGGGGGGKIVQTLHRL